MRVRFQAVAPPSAVVETPPVIGAVSLAGADAIGYAALAPVYEPFIGQPAEPAVLADLTRNLADAARRQGYLFATARVPGQAISVGVVRVEMELGQIDEVRIVGSDNKRLRDILDPLVGPAPTAAQIERRIVLAGDLPGMTVLGSKYDQKDGRRILEVRVAEVKLRGFVSVDNYGPRAYGPVRARASATAFNVGRDGSQLNVQVVRALDKDELSYGSLRYSMAVNEGAGLVGAAASVAKSEPGGRFAYPLAGRSKYASLYSNWVLKRSRSASAWLNTEIAYLAIEQSSAGVAYQDERTLTASASLSGNRAVGEGRVSGELGVTRGLAPATRLGADPLKAARQRGSSEFNRANIAVSYFRPIGERSALRVAAQAQTTDAPLPSSQEIGVGGPGYGRAYDFNERFGDKGVMASVELSHALKPKGLQAFAFVDGGKVAELGPQRYGEGSLASAGAGLRLRRGGVDADLYVAAPLNADRFASGDRTPRVGASLSFKF